MIVPRYDIAFYNYYNKLIGRRYHIFCPTFTLGSVCPLRRKGSGRPGEPHLFHRGLQFWGDGGFELASIRGAVHLELPAHFAPETLDLESLGSQAARRGLQCVPCPVVRAGHAFAARGIDGRGKGGLAERRAGLAVQCNAYHSGAFFLGIIAGGGDDSGCQLALADGGRIPSGYVVSLFVLLHQNDTDIISAAVRGCPHTGFLWWAQKIGLRSVHLPRLRARTGGSRQW